MKRIILTALIALIGLSANAQRTAYIDSEYMLNKIPDYKKAQEMLDKIAEGWQKEIEQKIKEVDAQYQKFQAEKPLLTDRMMQERIASIEAKESEIKELQKAKFGPEGELFKKRKELVQPIQEKVYDEVQKLAKAKSYDFILDKAAGTTLFYYNTRLNVSDEILKALGY